MSVLLAGNIFVLDLSAGEQSYVEDCEVCCRPIEVKYASDGEYPTDFEAMAIDE